MPDEEAEGQEGYEFELDSFQISSGGGVNALDNSLKLLEESLESNAAIAQFEVSKLGHYIVALYSKFSYNYMVSSSFFSRFIVAVET